MRQVEFPLLLRDFPRNRLVRGNFDFSILENGLTYYTLCKREDLILTFSNEIVFSRLVSVISGYERKLLSNKIANQQNKFQIRLNWKISIKI